MPASTQPASAQRSHGPGHRSVLQKKGAQQDVDPSAAEPHETLLGDPQLGSTQSEQVAATMLSPEALSAKRRPVLAILAGAASVIVIGTVVALMRPDSDLENDPDQPSVVRPETATLTSAMQAIENAPLEAASSFVKLVQSDPLLLSPEPHITPGHKGAVERLWLTDSDTSLVTFGYDRAPQIFDRSDSGLAKSDLTLAPFDSSLLDAATIDRAGSLVTAGVNESVNVWDLNRGIDAGQPIASLSDVDNDVTAITVHDGAIRQISVGDALGEVRLLRLESEKLIEVARWSTGREIRALSFGPEGKYLAALNSIGGGRVDQLDNMLASTIDASPHAIFEFPTNSVRMVQWVRQSNVPLLAMIHAGDAKSGGSVTFLEINEQPRQLFRKVLTEVGSEIESLHTTKRAEQVEIVAGDESGHVILADQEKIERIRFSEQAIAAVDVSKDGNWIVAGSYDGWVHFFKRDQIGKKAARLTDANATFQIDSVKIDEQFGWVYAGCSDGVIRAWPLRHLQLLALTQNAADVPPVKQSALATIGDVI